MADKTKPGSILFVCTGNTCRSPMAEYLFRELSKEKYFDIDIASRGTSALKDQEATDTARDVVLEIYPQSGIAEHKTARFHLSDFVNYSTILTMGNSHRNKILRHWPVRLLFGKKVFTLKEYAGLANPNDPQTYDITDPFGAGEFYPEELAEEGLLSQLSDQAYLSQKEGGPVRIIDPIVKRAAYLACREDINACLKRIIEGKTQSIEEIYSNRKLLAYVLMQEKLKAQNL
jgi:protein-tyrosine-phosphatase